MKKITITIDTVNAAFEGYEDQEIKRILQEVINGSIREKKLMDINGNSCGSIKIK